MMIMAIERRMGEQPVTYVELRQELKMLAVRTIDVNTLCRNPVRIIEQSMSSCPNKTETYDPWRRTSLDFSCRQQMMMH